jgi:hypothetical protein
VRPVELEARGQRLVYSNPQLTVTVAAKLDRFILPRPDRHGSNEPLREPTTGISSC